MNLTPTQWFLIIIGVLGALSGATGQMTDLFGPVVAKDIATAASLLSTIIAAILMPLTGQSAQIKSVLAMPGVDKLTVNANANQTLAAIAVDPSLTKIAPTMDARAEVNATAKGI